MEPKMLNELVKLPHASQILYLQLMSLSRVWARYEDNKIPRLDEARGHIPEDAEPPDIWHGL